MSEHPRDAPTATAVFDSPVGPLTAETTPTGVRCLSFGRATPAGDSPSAGGSPSAAADQIMAVLAAELDAYFAGTLRRFTVPLDWSLLEGTRRQVLRTLHETVGYGQTVSYGQLAAACGRPSAARLVGTIMGSNPIPIIVPCHRVVAGDGTLGGFGPGLPAKRVLLELEGALPAALFS